MHATYSAHCIWIMKHFFFKFSYFALISSLLVPYVPITCLFRGIHNLYFSLSMRKTQFHNNIHITFSCMFIISSVEKKYMLCQIALLCLLLWQYSNIHLGVTAIWELSQLCSSTSSLQHEISDDGEWRPFGSAADGPLRRSPRKQSIPVRIHVRRSARNMVAEQKQLKNDENTKEQAAATAAEISTVIEEVDTTGSITTDEGFKTEIVPGWSFALWLIGEDRLWVCFVETLRKHKTS